MAVYIPCVVLAVAPIVPCLPFWWYGMREQIEDSLTALTDKKLYRLVRQGRCCAATGAHGQIKYSLINDVYRGPIGCIPPCCSWVPIVVAKMPPNHRLTNAGGTNDSAQDALQCVSEPHTQCYTARATPEGCCDGGGVTHRFICDDPSLAISLIKRGMDAAVSPPVPVPVPQRIYADPYPEVEAVTPATVVSGGVATSLTEELKQLNDLRVQGVLTEEEFGKAKGKILSSHV